MLFSSPLGFHFLDRFYIIVSMADSSWKSRLISCSPLHSKVDVGEVVPIPLKKGSKTQDIAGSRVISTPATPSTAASNSTKKRGAPGLRSAPPLKAKILSPTSSALVYVTPSSRAVKGKEVGGIPSSLLFFWCLLV